MNEDRCMDAGQYGRAVRAVERLVVVAGEVLDREQEWERLHSSEMELAGLLEFVRTGQGHIVADGCGRCSRCNAIDAGEPDAGEMVEGGMRCWVREGIKRCRHQAGHPGQCSLVYDEGKRRVR